MSKQEIKLILSAVDQTSKAINTFLQSINGVKGAIVKTSIAISAMDYAFNATFSKAKNAILPAYNAVEDFNMSVIKMASMIASFQGPENITENYEKAKDYARDLAKTLEVIDAKTIAGANDLKLLTEEMAKQRILLDTNNQKQVEGFTNIANAVATITAGMHSEVQIRQEIRALMEGTVNMHSALASQIDAMVGGGLKEKIELWKQEGTLIENIGNLLQGYAAASDDIQGTWSSIGSTKETIKTQILRNGFEPAYREINTLLQGMNVYLKEHSAELSGTIYQGWLAVKGIGESVWNILAAFKEPLGIAAELITTMAQGFGLPAYSVLPVITDRIKSFVTYIWEAVKGYVQIGNMLWNIVTFNWDGMKQAMADAMQHFQKSGQAAGEVFATGFTDEIATRINQYMNPPKKAASTGAATPVLPGVVNSEDEEKAKKLAEKSARDINETYRDMYDALGFDAKGYYDFRKGLLEKQRAEEIAITGDIALAWEAFHARLRELDNERIRHSGSAMEGVRLFFDEESRKPQSWASEVEGGLNDLKASMADAAQSVTRHTESISDAFRNMAESILDSLAEIGTNMLINSLFGMVGNMFTTVATPAAGSTSWGGNTGFTNSTDVPLVSSMSSYSRSAGGGDTIIYNIQATDVDSFRKLLRKNKGTLNELTIDGKRKSRNFERQLKT